MLAKNLTGGSKAGKKQDKIGLIGKIDTGKWVDRNAIGSGQNSDNREARLAELKSKDLAVKEIVTSYEKEIQAIADSSLVRVEDLRRDQKLQALEKALVRRMQEAKFHKDPNTQELLPLTDEIRQKVMKEVKVSIRETSRVVDINSNFIRDWFNRFFSRPETVAGVFLFILLYSTTPKNNPEAKTY